MPNKKIEKKKVQPSGNINNKVSDASKDLSNKQHAENVANNHHYQNSVVNHAPTSRGK